MNQILVTEKVYVTPELKRKKNFYKFDFFLSVFLVCVLFSFYIYAEYDRNKNEEISREILADVKLQEMRKYPESTTRKEYANNHSSRKKYYFSCFRRRRGFGYNSDRRTSCYSRTGARTTTTKY